MESPGNTISSTYRGPLVDITIWICFVVSGLSVVTKVLTKLGRASRRLRLRNLQLDDYLLILAIILAAAQTIAVSRQVAAGLGKPISHINSVSLSALGKAGYAAQILYISTLCAAKGASILFALMLEPSQTHERILKTTLGLTILWALISIFGIAFQCGIPSPWDANGRCLNQNAFWTFIEVTNVLVDSIVATVLCFIVGVLQMPRTKYVLMCVFSLKLLLLAPIALKLHYIYDFDAASQDSRHLNATYQSADVAITTAVIMNIGILTTCIPFMKVLMEYLQPGWSTSDVRRGVGYNMMATKSGGSTLLTPNIKSQSADHQQPSRLIA